MNQAIDYKNVCASYGSRILFQEASFELYMGEWKYLIGSTGVGKTTLLRSLYADFKAEKGAIQVGKFDLMQISPKEVPYLRRTVGIVFQDFQLLPDRTVYENIAFALKATGWVNRAEQQKRITEVLIKVGMMSKAHSMPHQLSGGEQQRTVIARALINDPLILLCDEPTGNLDPRSSEHIMEILEKVNRDGVAVLFATHNYELMRKYPRPVLEIREEQLIAHPIQMLELKQANE